MILMSMEVKYLTLKTMHMFKTHIFKKINAFSVIRKFRKIPLTATLVF